MISWLKYRRARRSVARFLVLAGSRYRKDFDLWNDNEREAVAAILIEGEEIVKSRDRAQLVAYAGTMNARFVEAVPFVPPFRLWMRDALDFFAVVMMIIFGIRAMFLQTFAIPTGSMQPTLFGIHYVKAESPFHRASPRFPDNLNEILFSSTRAEAVVQAPGGFYQPQFTALTRAEASRWSLSRLTPHTSFTIGETAYVLPGEPGHIMEYVDIGPRKFITPGTVLADGFLSGGDYLFVERFSHLFRGLRRGDIVVFTTEDLATPDGRNLTEQSGYYYVKRLAGMPGDTLKIVDRKLYVRPAFATEFTPIEKLDARFEKMFSGMGGYHGYVHGPEKLMPHLATPGAEFTVPAGQYFMLGDNSANSLDSRSWGTVPRRNIVGRPAMVFWPFTRRWGIPDSNEPLPVETGERLRRIPAMKLQ